MSIKVAECRHPRVYSFVTQASLLVQQKFCPYERQTACECRDSEEGQTSGVDVTLAKLPVLNASRIAATTKMSASLVIALDRYEAHPRTPRFLCNRLGVNVVALVRLYVRLDILRRHQPHLVTLLSQNPP